jgi:hypothetical protein
MLIGVATVSVGAGMPWSERGRNSSGATDSTMGRSMQFLHNRDAE